MVKALKTIPYRQRACVVLRYYDYLSVAETAQALDIRPGTVKSQTSKGLAALKAALGTLGYPEPIPIEEGTRNDF